MLARLIQTLQPGAGDKALVVACGRGYGAALLARLVKSVVAVESDAGLASSADQTIKALGLANVTTCVTAQPKRAGGVRAPMTSS